MSIGQRISELRKNSSISQEYVAEKLGVSRQAVSKWETDASAPDTYNLIALAELFGVSVEYLATGKCVTETRPTQKAIARPHSTQKILGFILLSAGLLSLILGILLTEILIILSFYMLVGSIICLAVHKNLWLVSSWAFLFLTFFCFRFQIFCIFHPSFYLGGIRSIWIYVAYIFWLWLFATIILTSIKIVKQKKSKNK